MKKRTLNYSKNNRKSQNSGHLRAWLVPVLSAVVIASLICLGYWFYLQLENPATLPFKWIKIDASANHIPARQLKQTVKSHINGGFFSIDIKKLKQSLVELPWIESVSVRKIWPSTLEIIVQERQPVARWGEKALINKQGTLFYPKPKTIPQDLPLLLGPDESAKKVLSQYQQFNQELSTLGLSIRELRLSQRLAWHLLLRNGIELMLGRNKMMQRLRLFTQLYPRIIGAQGKRVARVDLRYPNGLAIRWRKSASLGKK